MKLEVDLGDRRKLEELRNELVAKLEVVEFVLSKLPAKAASVQPFGKGPVDLDFAESPSSLAGRIVKAITDMSDRFKSSDVYNRIPDISRSAIKDVFRQYVDLGRIKIVEQGSGQRPTIYQKRHCLSLKSSSPLAPVVAIRQHGEAKPIARTVRRVARTAKGIDETPTLVCPDSAYTEARQLRARAPAD